MRRGNGCSNIKIGVDPENADGSAWHANCGCRRVRVIARRHKGWGIDGSSFTDLMAGFFKVGRAIIMKGHLGCEIQ